jgi:hypothetical protein
MSLRAIILVALAAFMFQTATSADNATTIPSRNAAVVLPLLSHFSSKDGYIRVTEILGTEDFDIGNAYRECFFRLKDSPIIEVKASLDGNKIYFIRHGNDLLYSAK